MMASSLFRSRLNHNATKHLRSLTVNPPIVYHINLIVPFCRNNSVSFRRGYSAESHGSQGNQEAQYVPVSKWHMPFWAKGLVVIIIGVGWSQLDYYLTKDGQKHPITRLLELFKRSPEEEKNMVIEQIDRSKAKRDIRLFYQEEFSRPKPIYRLTFGEGFDLGSPFNQRAGDQVDLSDLVFKTD
ncbi:hypothetical protein G9A89_006367 [Geosiphon pyriformis]|nr:hypothetical protein G9A89_006367 [Geosiphon pyriformis]